ncbi:ORF-23 peptide [Chrysodeixis chalcites nucleopolyhedrovirus]|uniref:ORF-23 peptide n=1 Tax=Chrysodeixis chalcites nucleopolyhedrovirus TaxID=320432 RepID=Q4KT57_9ABAC|nr:ORF-23 peptide [Chrysodeixis chalcites nucleopolyhedrovirus]AGC36238.1 hypothetical protein TF1A_0023 [Chrysodeixis chalcites SNPV TF1-A]AAY83954.1 ORF-23 peptide [Chrysodeixis chalcites nucleopolyhedrovirus]AGE61285.1 hypothetical protein [Chrysodeixis chalcites nucleopolyhedrovirus]AGE61434.1 hypothetical protein [Chrysodeixis chalcites nucleopolyhedrovirus]AGE61583.1 hypothetical protein [Chrysodeixis chalcites nucleopolyhedrovirus]
MEYRSCYLLSNSAFSSKSGVRFKQYKNLMNLAKGLIPSSIEPISIIELEKFKMIIEPDTNYVSNIHDFHFYTDNKDFTVVHVLDANTRQFLGKLIINYNIDDADDHGIFGLVADLANDNSDDNDNVYQDSLDIEPI